LEKLNSRFSKCQVLIVVVSPALFQSKPCLEKIYNALQAKIFIVPIIFEGPIPPANDQWPMITLDDSEKNKLMLTKVTNEFSLNTVRPRLAPSSSSRRRSPRPSRTLSLGSTSPS
jgi:hypothetical protein